MKLNIENNNKINIKVVDAYLTKESIRKLEYLAVKECKSKNALLRDMLENYCFPKEDSDKSKRFIRPIIKTLKQDIFNYGSFRICNSTRLTAKYSRVWKHFKISEPWMITMIKNEAKINCMSVSRFITTILENSLEDVKVPATFRKEKSKITIANVTLPISVIEKLNATAKKEKRSFSKQVNYILQDFIQSKKPLIKHNKNPNRITKSVVLNDSIARIVKDFQNKLKIRSFSSAMNGILQTNFS